MRSRPTPIPAPVLRRASRLRRVRALDWVAAWLLVWAGLLVAGGGDPAALGVVAVIATGLGALLAPLRRRWRPVAAVTAFVLSSRLGPGDRAWLVTPDRVVPVLVTARRGFRVVIVGAARDPAEGLAVRRTRALLFPA
jgi:hypothetical protein